MAENKSVSVAANTPIKFFLVALINVNCCCSNNFHNEWLQVFELNKTENTYADVALKLKNKHSTRLRIPEAR